MPGAFKKDKMKKFLLFLFAGFVFASAHAQVRTSVTANVNKGEYIDLQSVSTGDTLQYADTVAYIIPMTHDFYLSAYLTMTWTKAVQSTGSANVVMSFFQGNDPVNFFPIKAGLAQSIYTKSFTFSATGNQEVSLMRDSALFEGRYLKVQFLTTNNILPAPASVVATPSGTGGTLLAGTYYYKITAINAIGETVGSAEASATTSGSTSSVALTWGAVTGATSYRIYRGTTAGGESVYYTSASANYTDTNAASNAGSPPATNTTGNMGGKIQCRMKTIIE
jgi:hypothetical protein